MKSEEGMPYTILMIKGHSLNGRPVSQMTRKQIMAHIAATNIEASMKKRAQNKAQKPRRRR